MTIDYQDLRRIKRNYREYESCVHTSKWATAICKVKIARDIWSLFMNCRTYGGITRRIALK